MRRSLSFVLVVTFCMVLAAPSLATAKTATGTPLAGTPIAGTPVASPMAAASNLVPKATADKAKKFLMTWFERLSNGKADSRHRAWESMTPNARKTLAANSDEQYFYYSTSCSSLLLHH